MSSDAEDVEGRAVDNGPWDGPAAMSMCAQSDDPARAYAAICAGRREGDPSLQSTWALPHHVRPGAPPNADGVRAAEARVSQTQGLTNREAAQSHLDAHMAAIQAAAGRSVRPPRDGLVREQPGDFEVRDTEDGRPVMAGHFSVFNQWTEIRSAFEGHFLERVAPGAFARTLAAGRMPVTFNHGKDPSLGDQVLGVPSVLEEDAVGARYEVPLFDGIPPLILDGLRNNAYGSSFRFRVLKEDFEPRPKRSAFNPDAIPERTITEAQVVEFGPVTYPAYAGATAGIRSATDDYLLTLIRSTHDALPDAGPEAEPHSDEGTREEPEPVQPAEPTPPPPPSFPAVSQAQLTATLNRKDHPSWTL